MHLKKILLPLLSLATLATTTFAANVAARKTGNWSDNTVWSTSATTPLADDANALIRGGYVITLDDGFSHVYTGFLSIAAATGTANGTLNASYGTLTFGTASNIGNSSTVNSTGTLNLSGNATLNLNKGFAVGGNGSSTFINTGIINASGGTMNVSGGDFIIANATNTVGTLNISGNSTINATKVLLGNGGIATLNMTAGNLNASSDFVFASAANTTPVTANISGGYIDILGATNIGGASGAFATVNLSGGTMNANNTISIGYSGGSSATLNVSNTGKLNSNGNFFIGNVDTSAGTVNLSGGNINTNGGGIFLGYNGNGTLNISGGQLDANDITVGTNPSASNSLLNITGGTVHLTRNLEVGRRNNSNPTGNFTMSGGNLTVDTAISIGAANGVANKTNGSATITGGIVNTPIIVVGNNSSDGSGYIDRGSGNLTIGSNARITVSNRFELRTSGTLTLEISDPAAAEGFGIFSTGLALNVTGAGGSTFETGSQVIVDLSGLTGDLSTFQLSDYVNFGTITNSGAIIDVTGYNTSLYDIDILLGAGGITTNVLVIPEPSTYALLAALALLAYALHRRRSS